MWSFCRFIVTFGASVLAVACSMVPVQELPPAEKTHTNGSQETVEGKAVLERSTRRPVAIVVSSDADAQGAVAQALLAQDRLDCTKYSLEHATAPIIAELISKQGIVDVIAIGQAAAESINPDDGFNVLYTQVFAETDLQTVGYRGVSALPPFALQIARWREVEPELKTIGVIASSDMKFVVQDLLGAAVGAEMSLRYEHVGSDKEALFVFQRMVPEIDGYIFLPDKRILSPQVIRKMMAYGGKHGTAMLTYSPAIAELGDAMHVAPDPEDIAEQIVTLLDQAPDRQRLPLKRLVVASSPETARESS